ncbi:hypothetical protein GGR51DRAFT_496491 [Nemania sp. FL0031]|nr:hypothetical protein GGR51DRAFT_496491 [Nemania sp. FL0031]
MSSKRSAPNNALAPRSEQDRKGRKSLRQVTEEQTGKKRGNDINDKGKDVPTKPSKIIKQDDGAPDPKLAVEDLLDLVSLPTLKKICAEVLQNETVGTELREGLLSHTQDIIATSRAEVIKEKNAIMRTANSAIQEVTGATPWDYRSCDDWPRALSPLLPRIKALSHRASVAGGPEKAWEALLGVAALCIYDWEGGHFKISGSGEEDCDDFHGKVDELMLLICEAQKQNDKIEWLRNGRRQEIWNLQEMARDDWGSCYTYRYRDTLEFLRNSSCRVCHIKEDTVFINQIPQTPEY